MEFHKKFQVGVNKKPSLINLERYDLRYKLMKDEVEEYLEGVQKEDVPNIAKELADVLFSVYGTIIEHGLQDKMEEVFAEVCRSNMSKDYHQFKMVKGAEYTEADIDKFFK